MTTPYISPLQQDRTSLTKLAAWVDERNLPFLNTSIGMIVMLLRAGSYKMTAPGAEGIVPLVSNSPLISWQFKIFGPYVGSDIIGLTEWTAAILMIAVFFKPRAVTLGGMVAALMFCITSTLLITTPDATVSVKGMFLYKDVISLGVAFYLISHFGKKAILSEMVNHE